MKKAFKIIIPLLLAIAVIGCAVWYLFVYDRSFTRDMLLSQARYFERRGDHTVAAWFYDRAYDYANQDEDVAIELAQQYKSTGNFTKAEYTLSNAIADGGTAKLYMALCQTYVEQDKLLDAVNMLNNISDPGIKAELDALRPAAPTADPEQGFYTQYLSVSITAESGTLYTTTDGEYPSLSDTPYQEPVPLGQGETRIYALAVGDNGLVSPLSIFGYTVGGVVEEVHFTDAAMEAAVREILNADPEDMLYTNDLWAITDFTMPEDAQSYSDLAYLPYLHSLYIANGLNDELGIIGSLNALESLTLISCRPTQEHLSAIAALPTLRTLSLIDCGLSSIEPLSVAQKLTTLDLTGNTIRNITPLSGMNQLVQLTMPHNALTDLTALSSLNQLEVMDISYNSVSSIAPICTLKNLKELNVSHNTVTSLGAVENLTSLTSFNAAFNSLTNIGNLAGCLNLREVNLASNFLSDLSSFSALTALETLNFSRNQVTVLPAFPSDSKLITIDGSHNQLSSLDALSGLYNLNQVLMDYNAEISDVSCLASCHNLYSVSVFGTKVKDVSALTGELDIIVNFDPSALSDDDEAELHHH